MNLEISFYGYGPSYEPTFGNLLLFLHELGKVATDETAIEEALDSCDMFIDWNVVLPFPYDQTSELRILYSYRTDSLEPFAFVKIKRVA